LVFWGLPRAVQSGHGTTGFVRKGHREARGDPHGRAGPRGVAGLPADEHQGLTQAGLLHYFDSKDELWVEILRRRDELDLAHDWQAADPAALLAAIVRHNAEVPGLVQMFVNLSAAAATDAEHPAHEYFRERYDRSRRDLSADFRAMQQDGRLRTDIDPDELTSVLLAVSDGMQIQWLFDPTRDMAEHVELVARLAIAQVTPTA
jgi:AcrR family transcriptional regulator